MTGLRDVFGSLDPFLAADGMIILEHESGKEILTGVGFEKKDERKWGFCAVSFYQRPEQTHFETGGRKD